MNARKPQSKLPDIEPEIRGNICPHCLGDAFVQGYACPVCRGWGTATVALYIALLGPDMEDFGYGWWVQPRSDE